jgi:hypothetical protein
VACELTKILMTWDWNVNWDPFGDLTLESNPDFRVLLFVAPWLYPSFLHWINSHGHKSTR